MRICVATNRGRSAHSVVERAGLLPLVEKIFTIHDVKRPKPAPDLIELAVSSFGAKLAEAVYVGDSELDREAALGAGVAFVGYRLHAESRIDEPHELPHRLFPESRQRPRAKSA